MNRLTVHHHDDQVCKCCLVPFVSNKSGVENKSQYFIFKHNS